LCSNGFSQVSFYLIADNASVVLAFSTAAIPVSKAANKAASFSASRASVFSIPAFIVAWVSLSRFLVV